MHRDEALALMKELEELEVNSSVDDDVVQWWSERYPSVPKEVLKFMVGQHDKWENVDHCGVVLHLYAGGEHQAKKWQCLQQVGFEVLTLDVTLGANHNLHGRQLYAYVTHLARSGQIKFVIGGPPCRTFSRLRHKRPGP